MSKDRTRRFGSAGELAGALTAAMLARPRMAHATWRLPVAAAVVGVVVSAAATIAVKAFHHHEKAPEMDTSKTALDPDLRGADTKMNPSAALKPFFIGLDPKIPRKRKARSPGATGELTFTRSILKLPPTMEKNHPASMVVADFNGDGRLDLALNATGPGPSLAVFLGTGEGKFGPGATMGPAGVSHQGRLAAGDLNGDGRPDLISYFTQQNRTTGLKVVVFLNKGDGTFPLAVTYPVGDAACVSIGDFNGDSKPDILVPDLYHPQAWLLAGQGDGTFVPHPFDTRGGDWALAALDVDHDGKLDLLSVFDEGKRFSVLLGDGYGGVAQRFERDADQEEGALEMADFNGDGIADFACLHHTHDSTTSVGIWLGQRDGARADPPFFKAPLKIPMLWPNVVTAGDFNGDGVPDLIVGGRRRRRPVSE